MAADCPSVPDEELARQTQAGSLSAFEELVTRYERRIYAFVAHSCSNAADASDVTQKTFVRAFQAIRQYKPRYPFASWLFTIARNQCIDHHRAAPLSADEPVPEQLDFDDPAQLMARREESQQLWLLAHRSLPLSQFQALWLKYAEDMEVSQIARVLRKTEAHVKVLLFRARYTLGQVLERQSENQRVAFRQPQIKQSPI